MNDLMVFNNVEFGEIRVVNVNNEPYFIGKDVASALQYKNTSVAKMFFTKIHSGKFCL